jgi:hypothetical protein
MMTKAVILRCIEDMERKLAELRTVVEQLSEATATIPTDVVEDLEQEESIGAAHDLHEVFAFLRAAWNIPPDVRPDMPLEELQKAMAEGLPENWASREIMQMREE